MTCDLWVLGLLWFRLFGFGVFFVLSGGWWMCGGGGCRTDEMGVAGGRSGGWNE